MEPLGKDMDAIRKGYLKSKYLKYLTKGEEPIQEFTVGFHKAVATNKRIIFVRRFPKAFIPIAYKNIANIEHHVYIPWDLIFKSLALLAASIYGYLKSEDSKGVITSVFSFFEENVPELSGIISAILPETVFNLLAIVLPLAAFLYFTRSVLSLLGRLKISVKGAPSVRIGTPLNNDVRDLMKTVETFMELKEGEVMPSTEEVEELEGRHTYLVKEYKPDKSFALFLKTVNSLCKGLYISRTNPEQIEKEHIADVDFQLLCESISIYWLTDSLSTGKCISPEPDQLFALISDFIEKNKKTVILLDGLEYLISHANFEQVLRFVQGMKDKVELKDCRLIIPINPQALSEKEMALLEREMGRVL
ncbi:MAG: DUF835 domain-containing protein [Candidatus Altiarchaeota archaeon]|nr:DUF835 domain-containing protein [Candidatus Altiarchaeota archaeon]